MTTGGQWQNVPQYWAKKRERLRHRPAKAKTAAVQAYRRRIIRDSNSSLPSTALPRRRRTVRFTDGPTAIQVFQISQLATSVSRGSGVAILPPVQQRVSILRSTKGDLTLTAAERRFIDEDTWRPVRPNSRHSAPAVRPTEQQIREVILQSSSLDPAPQRERLSDQPNKDPRRQPEHIAFARKIAHEIRDSRAGRKRREQAHQRARNDEVLERALPAVLQARRDKRANQTTIKLLREAQRIAAAKKSRKNERKQRNQDFQVY